MYQPLLLLPLLLTSAFATPHDPTTHHALDKRASFPIPASKGSVTYSSAKSISGTFDGGLKTYGRGVKCSGQKEGGDKDAVFILEDGATLKNAIIGADQIEGVHCKGSCTIQNVWWTDVCEGTQTPFSLSQSPS
jgi:pectate lyase